MSEKGIRPYGPGKYQTILDSYVHSVVLETGPDETLGSLSDNGVIHDLLRGGESIFLDGDPFTESLTDEEREKLRECQGTIVSEDEMGFVRVQYFQDAESLEAAFREIEESLSEVGLWAGEDEEEEILPEEVGPLP